MFVCSYLKPLRRHVMKRMWVILLFIKQNKTVWLFRDRLHVNSSGVLKSRCRKDRPLQWPASVCNSYWVYKFCTIFLVTSCALFGANCFFVCRNFSCFFFSSPFRDSCRTFVRKNFPRFFFSDMPYVSMWTFLCFVSVLSCRLCCKLQVEMGASSRPARNTEVEAEEPLPPGWATAVAPNGRIFYIDHNTKATTWVRIVMSFRGESVGTLLPC